MWTKLEVEPDGCWVLLAPDRRHGGRVAAEGHSRLWLVVARAWWWLQISP